MEREVIRGRLWVRAGKTSERVMAEVVGYCGTCGCQRSGRIEILEEPSDNFRKPKRVISLMDISRDPGIQSLSPCSSLSCSPSQESPPGNSFLSTSPSSVQGGKLLPLQIVLNHGEVLEFFLDTPEDQKQWMEMLGLLLMFPYSPIPKEPSHTIVSESFQAKLDPEDYGADSVCGVYILPQEVGSRLPILGFHILALRSRTSETQPGHLDIILPYDPNPIVSWDLDKIRRKGCLGNLVYIEIGQQCTGGPGLVWFFTGPRDEACSLKRTLHSLLLDGDMEILGSLDNNQHGTVHKPPHHSSATCLFYRPSLGAVEVMFFNNPSYVPEDDDFDMQPAAWTGHNSHDIKPRSLCSISEGVEHQANSQTVYGDHALHLDAQFVDSSPNYKKMQTLRHSPENGNSITRSSSLPSSTEFAETGLDDDSC